MPVLSFCHFVFGTSVGVLSSYISYIRVKCISFTSMFSVNASIFQLKLCILNNLETFYGGVTININGIISLIVFLV